MGKSQSKELIDDPNSGFNIIDKVMTCGGIIQFLYFVFFISTLINFKEIHDPDNKLNFYLKIFTYVTLAYSIVNLALISCYKTKYKKEWEDKTDLVNNILCETPGIKNKDLLNNKSLLNALISIQAFTVVAMLFMFGSITGKFCLDFGGKNKSKKDMDMEGGNNYFDNSEEFLRTTE